jgi:hypothetical protein
MSKIKSHGVMDDNQFSNLVIQLTDHLFEQGHTITRPLVIDAAEFARMYAESWFIQGKAAAKIEGLKK